MTPELARALTEVASADLGARIKSARVAAGLTQPDLGQSDASAAFLSRIERGERRPSVELLLLLAQRLAVTPEFLLIGEGWEDVRRLELLLDHAELSLAGGEADNALAKAREALASAHLGSVPGGTRRARLAEAGALDALGDAGAAEAYQTIVEHEPDQADPAQGGDGAVPDLARGRSAGPRHHRGPRTRWLPCLPVSWPPRRASGWQ